MWTSSLFCVSISLLVLILTVESAYYAYTYNDGKSDEEHCCLVRVQENFCLATPITRSLVQVNKQCHLTDGHKRYRSQGKKRNNKYLDQLSRRLNVQASYEIGDKILIELKESLEKDMLKNDLICLSSTHNNVNLEKCHVQLSDELDDDHKPHREQKRREHRRHRNSRHKKRAVTKINEEDSAIDDDNDEPKTEENEAENEVHLIELHQPLRVREGRGLSFRQPYKLSLSHTQSASRQQRKCLSWYRRKTQKMRRNPSKYKQFCIPLNDHNEKCVKQLVYNTFNDTEDETQEEQHYKTVSIPLNSKLYCATQVVGENKFIGLHHRAELCFQANNQVYIEREFTDIAGLTDKNKNKDTLQFIANHKKLNAEFEDDCDGQTKLVEITEPTEKPRSKVNHKQSKEE